MKTIVAAAVMLLLIFVALAQIIRNRKLKDLSDWKTRTSPVVLILAVLVLAADMLASPFFPDLCRFYMDLLPEAMAIWLLPSSFSDKKFAKFWVMLMLFIGSLILLYHVCRIWDAVPRMTEEHVSFAFLLMAALLAFVIVYGLWERVYDVKSLMKNGGIWTLVCMTLDSVYLLSFLLSAVLVQYGLATAGFLFLALTIAALGLRVLDDAQFLIWRRQERLIVESMKISSSMGIQGESRLDIIYKDLYERILMYFEKKKPYLDSELTINTLVRDLYSNKVYISRSISIYTGRNFCQFVNYYRVIHSVKSFRENPDLKVHELANFCGFNSVVSFNMAFRLFMGMNPSEWCRMERSRILKGLKNK